MLFVVLSLALVASSSCQQTTAPPYDYYGTDYPMELIPHVQSILSPMLEGIDIDSMMYGLDMISGEICNKPSKCNQNMFYPCECAKAFNKFDSGNEECKMLPCTIITAVKDNLRFLYEDLVNSETYEDAVFAMRDILPEIIEEGICPCTRDLFKAIGGCMKAPVLSEMVDVRSYNKVMKSPVVKKIWRDLKKPLCDCGLVHMTGLYGIARMIDQTRAANGTCLDKTDFMMSIMSNAGDMSFEPSEIRDFIDETAAAFWCVEEEECREVMNDEFNNCCQKEFLKVFSKKNVRGVMKSRLLQGMMGYIMEDMDVRMIEKMFGQVILSLQPELVCPDAGYGNRGCDDMEYEYN
eukprot:sb/3466218/